MTAESGLENREKIRAPCCIAGSGIPGARHLPDASARVERNCARSWAVRRLCLFLDEPTRGLDLLAKRDMWNLLRRLASAGVLPPVSRSSPGLLARLPVS